MKAIGYIRVSTEDQAKEGLSLDNQRAKIRAYCELKELELVEIVDDPGISGKNLKRPGVQKVLSMTRRKEVGAVIVYKLDRMFRSTVDALETTKLFDKWGVSFHSIHETLDTQSAMGRFFFTLTAALAEMERGIIGERTRAALRHKREQNGKTGGDVPFGFDKQFAGWKKVNGKKKATWNLTENENEQKAIRLIQDLTGKGYSLRAIGQELEKEGYKTKAGRIQWNPKTVSMILKRAANE
jgi:DNA invertase Pin-like site-specific DNA recombinase